jgi:hypothetical protein
LVLALKEKASLEIQEAARRRRFEKIKRRTRINKHRKQKNAKKDVKTK